jgi:adenylate cyclase
MTELDAIPAWLEAADGTKTPVQGACSIGRSPSNEVMTPSDKVSRRHAGVQSQRPGEYWLVDFGSRNGTFLNDRRIAQTARLRDGDKIRVGPFEFTFRQGIAASSATQWTGTGEATMTDIRKEHRFLMVADIEGSTKLARDLPPDEFAKITGAWLAACRPVIERRGGRINQFMGDGFFVCWRKSEGVNQAVSATLLELKELQRKTRPSFRIVLHRGLVAVGGIAVGEEERISGEEVHFVFRLEKLAGSLGASRLMSRAAQEHLAAEMPLEPAGSHQLQGFEHPLPFFTF